VHFAAQAPVDRENNLVGEGDLATQAKPTMLNFASAVRATGADMKDIVKVNIYLIDYSQDREADLFRGLAEAAKETGWA
jgi:enamine deaminase RidA (YjgF/YER057c/UK114 family)